LRSGRHRHWQNQRAGTRHRRNTVNPAAHRHPFDDTPCGGSSGGSAVAVATHMAPWFDHGGSCARRVIAAWSDIATPGVVRTSGVRQQTNYVQGPWRALCGRASCYDWRDPCRGDPWVPARCIALCVSIRTLAARCRRPIGANLVSASPPRSGSLAPCAARWDMRPSDRSARSADVDWHFGRSVRANTMLAPT
jgi:hypothetical protein